MQSAEVSGWLIIVQMGRGELCNTWTVRNNPLLCEGGTSIQPNEDDPDWTPKTNITWFTCDKYVREVTGDEYVLEENKKWLKWRIFDLEERKFDPDELMSTEDQLRQAFRSAKLEIFNAVPTNSSR